MNYEQLEEFLKNTYDEYDCVEVDKDDDVILIEEGDWINEGKYEYQESIFADRDKQSEFFTKVLTRYVYDLYYEDRCEIGLRYKDLRERNLKNVVGAFHKKQSDSVFFKGVNIVRRKLNED